MIKLQDSQISQILPEYLADRASVQALSFALNRAVNRVIDYCGNIGVLAVIDTVPDEILDMLALNLNTQYYDDSLPIQSKRTLIKNTLAWYAGAGTPEAVEGLVAAVYGGGEVKEWYEYGGDPYCFRVILKSENDVEVHQGQNAEFHRMLDKVKRLSAHLDAIYYTFGYKAEQSITYDTSIQMTSIFYPRYNVPYLYYDGTALYDGTYYYNQYRIGNVIDLYPAALSVQGDYQVRMRAECCKAGFGGILAKMLVTYQQDRITYTAKNNPSIQLDNCHLAINAKTTGKVKHQLHRIKVKGMKARLRVVSRIPKIAYVSDIRSTSLVKNLRIGTHTDMMLNIPKYRVQLTIGYHLTKYDGTYCYDGSRKYDSKVIVDTL